MELPPHQDGLQHPAIGQLQGTVLRFAFLPLPDFMQFIMAFWRTSYLIRPRTLSRLTALMLKAQELVDNDKRCITVFKKDAKYTAGDPIVAYAIFGTAYYQLHPFVFERLPAFFLTAINASVPYLLHEEYRRPAFSRNVTTA